MVLLMAIPPDRNMHSDKGSPSTSEGRKSSKPIMEKRRRARINASLSELKSLLLEVIKKEGSRHSKMEKADILEMTVKHLRQLQRQQFTGSPKTDTNVLNNYRLGFEECAQEVTRYLSQMDICDVDLRSRILNHLASSVSSGIFNPSPPTTPVSAVSPTVSSQPCSSSPSMSIPSTPVLSLPSVFNPVLPEQPTNLESFTSMTSGSPCINQPVQMTKVMSGVQLIPTKLQSGEIAFVVPSNVISSGGQVPSYIIPVYPQPATEAQPQSTIAPSTISPPTIISQMPIFQGAQPPSLPILSKPPETATQNLFVSAPPKQPMLTLQTSNPFYSTPVFTPRPSQPPSSTVTSQRQVNPRPMLLPNLPPDSIGNHPIRPDLPRDDSMWRPW